MLRRHLSVLMNPTSACNLRCRYCYVAGHRLQAAAQDMDEDDVRSIWKWLADYCGFINCRELKVLWFGGEPFLTGVERLSRYLDLQREILPPERFLVLNTVQSNLLLVGEEHVAFARRYLGGMIGGSLEPFGADRVDAAGHDVRPAIEERIAFLQSRGIGVGVVSTLTKGNEGTPEGLYGYMKSHRLSFRVNRAHRPDGGDPSKYLTLPEFDDYVLRLFDLYVSDRDPAPIEFLNFTVAMKGLLLDEPLSCLGADSTRYRLSFAGGGAIQSYCRKNPMTVGDYRRDTPADVAARYAAACPPRQPAACEPCRYLGHVCSGACFGEPGVACHSSNCGYRSEFTPKMLDYVSDYMRRMGIAKPEDVEEAVRG